MTCCRLGRLLLWSVLLLGLWWSGAALGARAESDSQGHSELMGFPVAAVTVDGHLLFRVGEISSYTAAERARAISDRINAAAADPAVSPDSLQIEENEDFTNIKAGDHVLIRVFNADAAIEGIPRPTLARLFQTRIGEGITLWRTNRAPETLKRSGLITLGATLLLVFGLGLGHWVYRRLRLWMEARLRGKVRDVQIQKFRLVRSEQLWRLLTAVLRLAWVAAVLVSVYFYLYGVLSLFPWTRGFARSLIHVLARPVKTIGLGMIDEVPDIVFLVVLFVALRYLLKLIHLFFSKVADGSVTLSEFEPDWAFPTYRLVRLMLIILGLVIAYPYIPGSESGAFKGLSIFIGVLFSLGSSSLIGNVIAGYTMTYRRAFRVGDRIRVGEHIGDVERIRLLCTHLRTLKNEVVVIPNSLILNGEIVNYSTLAREQGVILHTTVGIGYETPWRQVEAMLLEAASRTLGVLLEPAPFVLQKGLGDFCITYEINVYCQDPKAMTRICTDLHRCILDVFNEFGVQIMTPAYEDDPEKPKVVPKEQWYPAPAILPKDKEAGLSPVVATLSGRGDERAS